MFATLMLVLSLSGNTDKHWVGMRGGRWAGCTISIKLCLREKRKAERVSSTVRK